MDLDLAEASRRVRALLADQRRIVMARWPSVTPLTMHDRRDLSTAVDVEVERRIKDELRARYPQHGLLGEETADERPDAEYQWVIDPIDGTKYYAGHASLFSISVGLLQNGEPVLGVVYSPSTGQCFHAHAGGGAFLDEQRLEGPRAGVLAEVIASVEMPASHRLPSAEREWFEHMLVTLTRHVYRVRAFGSSALAACWLASGALDAYIDLTGYVKPHDIAAGRMIMQAAGAKVEFVEAAVGPPRLVAAPKAIWKQLRGILSE